MSELQVLPEEKEVDVKLTPGTEDTEKPEVIPTESKEPEQEEKKEPEKKDEKSEAEKRAEKKAYNQQKAWERLVEEKAAYKAKVEMYEQMMAQQKQEQTVNGRPQRDAFSSDEDYVDALTDWKIDQKMQPIKEEREIGNARKVQEHWSEKVDKARGTYPDYDSVFSEASDVPIEKHVADVLFSSDMGADVAYYLAKHTDEMEKINRLDPISAAKAVGRIEERIERERSVKSKPLVSKAPEPIRTPTSSSSSSIKNLEDMSMKEYVAYMDKQEASKRKH